MRLLIELLLLASNYSLKINVTTNVWSWTRFIPSLQKL